jgi:hypothetical protein
MALLEEFDSSNFADIQESIENSKENRITLSNISKTINFKGRIVINDNHILKDYEDFIMNNLVDYNIDEKSRYKPEYVSKEVYGTTDLWYLILWVNRMVSASEFIKTNIKIFDPLQTKALNKIIERHSEEILESKDNPILVEDLTVKKVVFR